MRRRLACNTFYLEILSGLPFESPGRLASGERPLTSFTSQIIHSLDLNIGERDSRVSNGWRPLLTHALP